MIRPATPADLPGIVELAVEALQQDPIEELVISRERIFNLARECVSSAAHFAWVCEQDGKIQGAVIALVTPLLFYQRNQATILMWFCKVPGEGVKLMREFLKWARGRRGIKVIEYTGERGADPRIGKTLERMGLRLSLPIYVEVR